jgi:hypothetical protein
MKWNSDLEGDCKGRNGDHLAMVQATSGAVGELSQKLSEGIGVAVSRREDFSRCPSTSRCWGAKTFSCRDDGIRESCLMAEEAFCRFDSRFGFDIVAVGGAVGSERRVYVPVFSSFLGSS